MVGTGDSNSGSNAYVWNGSTTIPLGTLGRTNSFAGGINNAGQAVGFLTGGGLSIVGAIWNGTTPTALGSPFSAYGTFASGINNSGQVVGQSFRPNAAGGGTVAIIWNGMTPTALGVPSTRFVV